MIQALRLALLVPLLAAAPQVAAGADTSVAPVNAYLCDSAAHAIQFADAMAAGEDEDIAKDQVGRAAQAEVCGLYVGSAVVESEQVKLSAGTAYKLTAYRFQRDHRVAWLAERTFGPTPTNWDL